MKKIILLCLFLPYYQLLSFDNSSIKKSDSKDEKTVKQISTVQSLESKKFSKNKLTIATLIQARIMIGEKYSNFAWKENYDTIDFNFRRLRLTTKYKVSNNYGGLLTLKGENMLSEGKSGIQEANIWIKNNDILLSKFTFGQFKLPFVKEQLASSAKLLTPEKSFSTETLQAQDIGIRYQTQALNAVSKKYKNKLQILLSISNGDGSGQNGVGRKQVEAANQYNSPLYNWRIQYNPFGNNNVKNKDLRLEDGSEIFSQALNISIGYAGVLTPDYEYDSNGLLNNGEDLLGHTFDFSISLSYFYISTAYTFFQRAAAVKNTSSYQTTLAYNYKLNKYWLMPLLRYDYFQADLNSNGAIAHEESITDFWLGLNYYIDRDDLKAQFFYKIHSNKNSKAIDKDDNVFYFQLSSSFTKDL